MPSVEPERLLAAGRYRLDGVIGSGGVGRVWRGEDTILRRGVAIKEVPLPSHLPDDERQALRARVLREAQAAARIHHPGSVQVFDVVDADDTVYLVMELVEDLTLAEVVEKDGPLSPRATAAMGAELLGALDAAHKVGIVHRDVKPRNVMVLPSGGVKLADFGIASLRDDPRITKTGMVLGTPSYMSPEQALGKTVGPPTDIWGTGALLYFAVEGTPPFDRGEPIATLHAVVHGDRRPYERAGELAPVLDELMARDPDDRIDLEAARARLESIARGDVGAARTLLVTDATTVAARAGTATHVAPGLAAAPPLAATQAHAPRTLPPPRRPPPEPYDRETTSSRGLPYGVAAAVLIALLVAGIALAARGGEDGDSDGDVAAPDDTTATTEPLGTAATTVPGNGAVDDDALEDPARSLATGGASDDDPADEAPAATTVPTTPQTTATSTPTVAGGARPEGVPASWVSYTSPSLGWSVWHPPGWEPRDAAGNATDFRDPASGTYLRVDYVQPPGDDAVAAWDESSARQAGRYPDYQELRIEPATYRGFEAALWEYTYQGQRATNLGFITPGTGFALNFQTSASRWDAVQDTRRAFEASFTPPS